MHTTNYYDTLILPSPDSKAPGAMLPGKSGTVASMTFERLTAAPYSQTSDELIFAVQAERAGVELEQRDEARQTFFSKGQACLRSSALVKTLGWALHHDATGRVGLIDPASALFQNLVEDETITKRFGLRSKRA